MSDAIEKSESIFKEYVKDDKEVKEFLKFKKSTDKRILDLKAKINSEEDEDKKEKLQKQLTDLGNEILQKKIKTIISIRKALGGPVLSAWLLMKEQDWVSAGAKEDEIYFNIKDQ